MQDMKKTHTCTSLVCCVWFAQRLLESLWTSRLWHKTREGIFFSFKKGPPTFQCNETPPIPQTLLIHIYSTLMLIYTLSWCMQTFIQYPLLWGDKTVAPTQRKSSCSFDTTPRHPGYTAQPPQGWTCSG